MNIDYKLQPITGKHVTHISENILAMLFPFIHYNDLIHQLFFFFFKVAAKSGKHKDSPRWSNLQSTILDKTFETTKFDCVLKTESISSLFFQSPFQYQCCSGEKGCRMNWQPFETTLHERGWWVKIFQSPSCQLVINFEKL